MGSSFLLQQEELHCLKQDFIMLNCIVSPGFTRDVDKCPEMPPFPKQLLIKGSQEGAIFCEVFEECHDETVD